MAARFVLALTALCISAAYAQTEAPEHKPDVPYVATQPYVVDAMLELAAVKPADLVYDLGCGDGRIVITAALNFHAHGVCIEIDPDLIQRARANAAKVGVEKMIEFRQGNFFQADIRDATVVTLFLLPRVNLQLRPKLQHDLRPGARVVSQAFDMGDWKPNKLLSMAGGTVYLWVIRAAQ
jgi:precorrin-6B methylase 2